MLVWPILSNAKVSNIGKSPYYDGLYCLVGNFIAMHFSLYLSIVNLHIAFLTR